MPDNMIQSIADQANMIIAGFSYTATENGHVRVLNLEKPEEACVLDKKRHADNSAVYKEKLYCHV